MKTKIKEVDPQYQTEDNLRERQAFYENKLGQDGSDYFLRLFDNIPNKEAQVILDQGCGNGRLWVDNIARVPPSWKVCLMDQSAAMIDSCRKILNNKVEYFIGNIENLPFDDDTFDLVICFYVLYHVSNLDLALNEVRRVLKPEGEFHVITVSGQDDVKFEELVVPTLSETARTDYLSVKEITKSFSVENSREKLSHYFNIFSFDITEKNIQLQSPKDVLTKIKTFSENLKNEDYSTAESNLLGYFNKQKTWNSNSKSVYIKSKPKK